MSEITTATPLRTRIEGGGSPRLDHWGATSEYGVLRDVLLGTPGCFRWLGEENAQYSALVRETLRKGYGFDRDLALRQHAEIVDAYRDAGVAIHMLEARDELAYGVYARDSSFMTPFGAVICQLASPRRRGEYATTLRFYLSQDIPIYDLVSAGNFEGGDFNMIEPGSALIGYTGRPRRGDRREAGRRLDGARGLRGQVRADRRVLRPHRPDGLHAGAEARRRLPRHHRSRDRRRGCGRRRSRSCRSASRDTMALGCNVVALGNDRVLSVASSTELNAKLRALGFTVYDPDMSQFLLAGGGVHCMSQQLRRDPV